MIEWAFLVPCKTLLSTGCRLLICQPEMRGSVCPKMPTIGVLVRPAMCIIPVSIVTTASRRVAIVVTKAGHASVDLLSGNIA